MKVLIPRPAQTSEKPSASSTFPAQPVPSPWTKPSHSAAIWASVIPGLITPRAWSIAAAAISFASRMRSISCSVLRARASTSTGVASTAPGKASNQAFVYVVGSPTIRSDACVPSESSRPDRPVLGRERGDLLERPHDRRPRIVGEVAVDDAHVARPRSRAASSAEASTQKSVGSPSRGNTTASQPFIPQKLVR